MEAEELKCPECGSTYIRLIAFHDSAPFEEQYQYTCMSCHGGQFNPVPEETITISKSEYAQLLEDQEWLQCLEAAGVDNWTGFEEAQDIRDSLEKGK